MPYTISTHNGSQVRRAHNIRAPNVVQKQEHIQKGGLHEIWHDETPAHAYHRLFDEAVKKYNIRQAVANHPERCIENYYRKIQNDKSKSAVYEMIVAVGNKDSPPPSEVGYAVLKKFVSTWKDRNPNLEIIGAYYHADEEGVPHVHIDYVPWADGLTRGMTKQNSLRQAFAQQGIDGLSQKVTAQILWERNENQTLEKICSEHGLEIEHPGEEGRRHIDTDTYKARMELQRAKEEVKKKEDEISALGGKVLNAKEVDELSKRKAKKVLGKDTGKVELYEHEYKGLVTTASYVNEATERLRKAEQMEYRQQYEKSCTEEYERIKREGIEPAISREVERRTSSLKKQIEQLKKELRTVKALIQKFIQQFSLTSKWKEFLEKEMHGISRNDDFDEKGR